MTMNSRFLSFYEQELAHVRQTAGEFAREFPKIAGRLALPADGHGTCPDPLVERLLEGFAFLAARVQLKLTAEFPTFTQALLDTVYPHYLCPLPAMTIVRFEPDCQQGNLLDGYRIPRGSALRSRPPAKATTSCEFRTAHDVTLWPVRVADARYLAAREIGTLDLPPDVGAKAAIRLRLELPEGMTFAQLQADSLVFHLTGPGDVPAALYESLFARMAGLLGGASGVKGGRRVRLPHGSLQQRGFAETDALLPPSPRSFEGYRLLQEYFALPQRVLFAEVSGLRPVWQTAGETTSCELLVMFTEEDIRLEGQVSAACFELYCTPAINLFERRCEHITLDGRSHEHAVVPERGSGLSYEVFQVTRVAGLGARAEDEQRFEPFFLAREDSDARAYYTVRRELRALSATERELGAEPSYPGMESWISLVDADHAPYRAELRQLAVRALCTNRHLPLHIPLQGGSTDFALDVGAPVKATRCLVRPTTPRASHAVGEVAWRLVSHLSLNYLSLVDHDDGQGAVALRELLRLYTRGSDPQLRLQVEGVRSVTARAIVRRVENAGPIAFARGLEVAVRLRESNFKGTGAFLFGAVLDRFFAKYTSINSFTETVVLSQERGELVRWPTRVGKRDLM